MVVQEKYQLVAERAAVLAKYNKTEEGVKSDMDYLIEWYKKQPHLPPMNEKKMEIILLHSKFSLEKTKEKLDMHYTVRNYVPELFSNWDPLSPEVQLSLDTTSWCILPKVTPNLGRVAIFKLLDTNPDRFQPWEYFKSTFLFSETYLPNYINYGDEIIYDLDGFKFAHISKLTPALLKKVETVAKKAYSLKLQSVNFLNAPSQLNVLLNILKPILKPKIFARIHNHENNESLHKIIPPEILPKEYGGTEDSLMEIWAERRRVLEGNRANLIAESKVKSNESKRIDKLDDSIFGSIHGSFRKLQVD